MTDETKLNTSELDIGAIHAMRQCAKEGLGFNCTFVDDDMRVIVGLAQRAVLAGLASDFDPDMQKRFMAAAGKHRRAHEKSLGRQLGPRAWFWKLAGRFKPAQTEG
jgi:hypothetical protein